MNHKQRWRTRYLNSGAEVERDDNVDEASNEEAKVEPWECDVDVVNVLCESVNATPEMEELRSEFWINIVALLAAFSRELMTYVWFQYPFVLHVI